MSRKVSRKYPNSSAAVTCRSSARRSMGVRYCSQLQALIPRARAGFVL